MYLVCGVSPLVLFYTDLVNGQMHQVTPSGRGGGRRRQQQLAPPGGGPGLVAYAATPPSGPLGNDLFLRYLRLLCVIVCGPVKTPYYFG